MFGDGLDFKDDKIYSFLMIGQSNMAGRGEISDVPPIKNDNCYMLRMGRWQPMREPINPDRAIFEGEFRSGVGLAASFADSLAAATGKKIGLIPCADGGTRIEQWQPGEVLFDHAVMMAKLAMRSSRLSGILWHQGESDCTKDEHIALYKERFIKMINGIREELGEEELPFISGELAEHYDARWNMGERYHRINEILHELESELPNFAVVSSAGLSMKPDGIHFDAASCRVMGRRYFEAYTALINK